MANAATSAATIVDPTGVPAKIEITIPESAQSTDRTAEKIVTILKLWKSRMADSAGKMTSAEISSDPRIPAAVLFDFDVLENAMSVSFLTDGRKGNYSIPMDDIIKK